MITVENTVKITFQFDEQREDDLLEINDVLSRYELESLEFEERDLYLATCYGPNEEITHRYYGMHKGVMVGHVAKPGEGFRYRIDTEVLEGAMDTEDYHRLWCIENPDRTMRNLISGQYDEVQGFLVAHHAKKE